MRVMIIQTPEGGRRTVQEKGTLLKVLKIVNNSVLPGMNFKSLSYVPSLPDLMAASMDNDSHDYSSNGSKDSMLNDSGIPFSGGGS